jgi:hypothetical protein
MRLALLGIASLLAGCDYIHGVVRTAPVLADPPVKCIEEAIASVEGIRNVSYSLEEGGRPLTLRGIEKADEVHRFWYEYHGVRSNVYFVKHHGGSAQYHHSYGCINCTPPQEVIDRIYPAMLAIETALESRCDLVGLRQSVRESCTGVRCGGA